MNSVFLNQKGKNTHDFSLNTVIAEINFVNEYEVLAHYKINHSETFVVENGDHTNNTESTWNGMKYTMTTAQIGKSKCPIYILTFIWRRPNKVNQWNSFLPTLKNLRFEAYHIIYHFLNTNLSKKCASKIYFEIECKTLNNV